MATANGRVTTLSYSGKGKSVSARVELEGEGKQSFTLSVPPDEFKVGETVVVTVKSREE